MNNTLGMWTKDYEVRMGDIFKQIEHETYDEILATQNFVIRVDGRAFHTFTRGMEKPYSFILNDCRRYAAQAVLRSMKPDFAYHQSDEISYVWTAVENPETQVHPFNGRVDKLVSLAASLTTAAFLKRYIELTGDFSKTPHFDGRLAGRFDSIDDAILCVQWRENDAMRNSVQMLGQSMFSHKQLQGKNVFAVAQMCKEAGVDWKNDMPPEFSRGTYVTVGPVDFPITEEMRMAIPEKHRPAEGTIVTRSQFKEWFFDDWDITERRKVLLNKHAE